MLHVLHAVLLHRDAGEEALAVLEKLHHVLLHHALRDVADALHLSLRDAAAHVARIEVQRLDHRHQLVTQCFDTKQQVQ